MISIREIYHFAFCWMFCYCICICIILEICSLLSKNYPVSVRMHDGQCNLLICIWFLRRRTGSCNLLYHMVTSSSCSKKKECLRVSVVQMGSLSDFQLLIRVFPVLRCRCVSAGIATRPFNICKVRKDGVLVFLL